jgi:hypothetical protein
MKPSTEERQDKQESETSTKEAQLICAFWRFQSKSKEKAQY